MSVEENSKRVLAQVRGYSGPTLAFAACVFTVLFFMVLVFIAYLVTLL